MHSLQIFKISIFFINHILRNLRNNSLHIDIEFHRILYKQHFKTV